jgi:phenylpropionate dioxygenase-like ring-hydroxylating dioxygenase large terminal subunit
MPLNAEDNDLLTRVVGTAPMGLMVRENFWVPVGLSSAIIADGRPLRVRRLGENFVLFRATDGRVGLFREACPHRGTSLALARNEDNSLRCIFHGWKFGVDGEVKEVPTQPVHHKEFCAKVPLKHFPTREAGGLVWAWLGGNTPKRFPAFEFTALSGEHVYPVYQTLNYNWITHLEGQVDSAHLTQLHQSWLATAGNRGADLSAINDDAAPTYEFDDMPGGFRYAAIRRAVNDQRYVRITAYVAPWYTFIGFGAGMCVISVPIDDEHTALYMVSYNCAGPFMPSWNAPAEDPMNWPPYLTEGPEQHWGQDRGAMMRDSFSGFPLHPIQEDFAVAESQGAILNRTKEFLNAADQPVVHLRMQLLRAVKAYRDGRKDDNLLDEKSIPYETVKALGKLIPATQDWRALGG